MFNLSKGDFIKSLSPKGLYLFTHFFAIVYRSFYPENRSFHTEYRISYANRESLCIFVLLTRRAYDSKPNTDRIL
jgi:hypothetical protein